MGVLVPNKGWSKSTLASSNGTSMATPAVAGLIACILERHNNLDGINKRERLKKIKLHLNALTEPGDHVKCLRPHLMFEYKNTLMCAWCVITVLYNYSLCNVFLWFIQWKHLHICTTYLYPSNDMCTTYLYQSNDMYTLYTIFPSGNYIHCKKNNGCFDQQVWLPKLQHIPL